jgi:hypothetical protein
VLGKICRKIKICCSLFGLGWEKKLTDYHALSPVSSEEGVTEWVRVETPCSKGGVSSSSYTPLLVEKETSFQNVKVSKEQKRDPKPKLTVLARPSAIYPTNQKKKKLNGMLNWRTAFNKEHYFIIMTTMKLNQYYVFIVICRSQWPRGLSHELSSLARTLE